MWRRAGREGDAPVLFQVKVDGWMDGAVVCNEAHRHSGVMVALFGEDYACVRLCVHVCLCASMHFIPSVSPSVCGPAKQ